MTRLDMESWARDIQRSLGLIHEHAGVALAELGKDSGGAQPPPPTEFDSFGGTYGVEHGEAFDHYPNGEDGPHYGYEYRCPAAGTVSRYSFGPGPLDEHSIACIKTGPAGSLGYSAAKAPPLLRPDQLDTITALGTWMHIAVLTFDQPQRTPGGRWVRAIWIGHVQDGFPAGRRNRGDRFALCGRSGIEFAGCDASHGHVCGTATGQLSPNGDVSGIEVVRLLGFRPRETWVPGPTHYMSGGFDRGKPR